ncbi:MAG: aldo/keto reductase [Candidatus Anammoxibacter sp.]
MLGKTGLKVSSISLGTVELGMEYGIRRSEEFNRPDRNQAIYLLQYAIDKGINLFDTAPNYGVSEEIVGSAISNQQDCYIATKVSIPASNGKMLIGAKLREGINRSIERSLRVLRRESLDIVQIHNATVGILNQDDVIDVLLRARKTGKVRFLGVSVYEVEEALAAINLGCFDVIQVAFNLLDQRMTQHVFPAAKAAGVGIINRSALLKGVLTPRVNWLTSELKPLSNATEKVINSFSISLEHLPELAISFCLSSEFVQTVLIGVSNKDEIDIAINAELNGPLDSDQLEMAGNFAMHNERLLNPSYWPTQ